MLSVEDNWTKGNRQNWCQKEFLELAGVNWKFDGKVQLTTAISKNVKNT